MSQSAGRLIWPISEDGPVALVAGSLSDDERLLISAHANAIRAFQRGDDLALDRFEDGLAIKGISLVVGGVRLVTDPDTVFDLTVSGDLEDYELYTEVPR